MQDQHNREHERQIQRQGNRDQDSCSFLGCLGNGKFDIRFIELVLILYTNSLFLFRFCVLIHCIFVYSVYRLNVFCFAKHHATQAIAAEEANTTEANCKKFFKERGVASIRSNADSQVI